MTLNSILRIPPDEFCNAVRLMGTGHLAASTSKISSERFIIEQRLKEENGHSGVS
jgi:hypothetical protein